MTEIPKMFCRQIKNQLVFDCLKCGKQHYHGLGEGHRLSHCLVEDAYPNGYDLVVGLSCGQSVH